MVINEITPSQMPALLNTIKELASELGLSSTKGLERFVYARSLGDISGFPALCLASWDGEEMAGFALGGLRQGKGVIKLFGVRGPYRRQGIGAALLAALEARLHQRGATTVIVGGVAPHYFAPGVPIDATPAIAFLYQRGYECDRVARVDMTVQLAAGDFAAMQPAVPGLTLSRATIAEVEDTAAFARAYFSEGWRQEVADAAAFEPIPLFIARDGAEIVGFAAYDVTGYGRFGPTGTRPDYRHRGIGRALCRLCLLDMRARGDDVAHIGWAGPIAFYARAVGARIGRAYWVFHKELSPS